jgi:hypothetical protein
MGSSKRWGTRAVAVIGIASVAVVWAATAAQAKQINSVSQLKTSCAKGNGTYTQVGTGSRASAICDVQGGTVICQNTPPKGQPKCAGVKTIARSLVPAETVRGANGVVMTVQGVSDSQVWKQKVSSDTLSDVCAGLNGNLSTAADATTGTCTTPTATIVCRGTLPGTNCVGIADTEKHAKSIPKQIKVVVANSPSTATTGAPGTPTTTAPATTTATTAPATTRATTPSTRG